MPQLDKFTYFTQFFWSCLFLFTFYIAICNDGDGLLGISRILKLRNQLVSHRENNIRSKDPNSLEDILRKGFSTGVSYMYSSLFEVSQWCKAVDLLGKRRSLISGFLFLAVKNPVLALLFLEKHALFRIFSSCPGVEKMTRQQKLLVFAILKYVVAILLSRVALNVWMDELSRAIEPFFPSTSGGMAGSSSTPPGPAGDSWVLLPFSEPHQELPNDVPEIPQEDLWDELDQPLLSEPERKEQIKRGLLIYLPLENEGDHLNLEKTAEIHYKVEIEVERHLRMEGYSPDSIRKNWRSIRGFLMKTQKNTVRPNKELSRFLLEMSQGWRNSKPCQIINKQIKNCSFFL